MLEDTIRSIVFESMEDPLQPIGRQMATGCTDRFANLVDILGRMRKIEDTDGILTMSLHDLLQPQCSILNGTHCSRPINSPSPDLCTHVITKVCRFFDTREIRQLVGFD